VQPPAPKVGFGAAFKEAASRKLRELRGQRWQGASPRARKAEAARRAASEVARRVERQTGVRPKESTIRRAARDDRTPRGADQARLDRQARIDAAGGVKKFAQKTGVSARKAASWRDKGKAMLLGGVQVITEVEGTLWVNGENYGRSVSAVLHVDPPASDDLYAAYAADDLEAVAEMLGPLITEQVEWTGDAERSYEVETINAIAIT